MTIVYSLHHLSDLRHRFRELTDITAGRDPVEYRDMMKWSADAGMMAWIAEVDNRIIGSIGFMTTPTSGFHNREACVSAAAGRGLDPDTIQMRTLIYVHPDHRGQGIAHQLEIRANQTSRDLGFTHRAAFAYQTDEIYHWIHRHGNAIDLDVVDPTGYPVTVVPIDRP